MVKTSRRRQRGLGIVRKHLIRLTDALANDGTSGKPSTLDHWLQKVPAVAKIHWDFLLRICSMCCFIPVDRDPETNRANLSPIWKRCIHYILVTMYGLILIYRIYMTMERVSQGKLDILTYMCASVIIVLLVPAASTLGTTWSPQALSDLFNYWKSMENFMGTHMGRRMTAFDEKATCVKVVLLALLIHLAAANAAMLSFVGDMPTSVVTTLTRIGWLELPDFLPRIFWSFAFMPLEMLMMWPPVLSAAVCTSAMAMTLGGLKVFTEEARKTPVRNMDDWMRVYRLRRITQVGNVNAMDWGSGVATMLLVCVSSGVIILLYVTIRPSDLPFIVYIMFPIVSCLLMVITTLLCYDCVIIKRTVEDIDGRLEIGLNRWRFRDINTRRNTAYSRMLKSLRPILFKFGSFAEITLDVPINVWDEVLNQLLFLLSL